MLPAPASLIEARAALVNGLAITGRAPTFQADPTGFVSEAERDPGVQLLMGMAERLRQADGDGHPPPVARDSLVVGLDVGGTDLKVVALSSDQVVYTADPTWSTPPHRMTDAAAYLPVLGEHVRAAAQAAGRAVDAIGLSFPDICHRGAIVGGISSKMAAMRAVHGDGYWSAFDRSVRPLAQHLSQAQGVPVHLVADGVAAAAWAAAQGHRSTLVLSLGTSIAAATVDADGHPLPWPLYAGAAVIRPGDGGLTAHRTTGVPGSLQQYPTQTGIFRAAGIASGAQDRQQLRALQASSEPAILRIFTEAGHALAQGIELFRAWLGDALLRSVLILGRLTEPGPGTDALLAAVRERSPAPVLLPGPHPWPIDAATHGQALGVALLARGGR